MSLLPPTILNDLQLERRGYKVFPMGPYYQAFPTGIPVLESTRTGLLALRHLLAPRECPVGVPIATPTGHSPAARRSRWSAALGAGPLPAADLFAMLRDYGIPAVAARSAVIADEALRAADELDYPVALKTDASSIAHKSDVDGVILGIANPADLAAAYQELAARLGPRVTVTEMAAPGPELILGMARDRALGPLIVVGAGGVLAEHLAERSVALPPLARDAAGRMIAGLRVSAILDGVRGQPPCDLDAINSAIVCFSALVTDLGDHLAALDINPLICSPGGVVAVDALAVMR